MYEKARIVCGSGYKANWDYYRFRQAYKRVLQTVLENKQRLSLLLKENHVGRIREVIIGDCRLWEPALWASGGEDAKETGKEEEKREGTFACAICARKGDYARNTTHYEKQTRSSDEPMTVFMHCHSCGRHFKFSS